jgi:two-component system OmpR family response regulator
MNTAAPHILVVDDDPALRELMTAYLTENEFQVTAVATGAEMTAVLQDSVIDLVLLDLRLEAEDGMQLARQLRDARTAGHHRDRPQDEADRVMGLEIAADDYVTKPFSNRELLARVRAVLRRYQACRLPRRHPRAAPSAAPTVSRAGS